MTTGIASAAGVQIFSSGTTFSNFADNLMTQFFLPILADARNNSTVLYNLVQKAESYETSGRFIVWPVRTTRNAGRNAFRHGGRLADPTAQGAATYFAESRKYHGRVKIDGDIIRRGRTNGGAFITAQELELQGQVDDITVDYNRMLHSDGSGRLGESSGTNTLASGIIGVRWNADLEGAPSMTTAAFGKPTMYIEVGDRIALYIPGSDTLDVFNSAQSGFFVISKTNTSITVSATPGGAALDLTGGGGLATAPTAGAVWIVRCGSDGVTTAQSTTGTAARAEMMGIGGIFSDAGVLDGLGAGASQQVGSYAYTSTSTANGPFQGINATAANSFNQAVILDNGGAGLRALTEALLQQAFSDAEEINNAEIDLILSSYGTYNSYLKLLTPDKRFNDTLELRGGHKLLSFNGVGWYKDRYCRPGAVYMLALNMFRRFEVEALQPLDYLGTGRWERLQDFDAYFSGYIAEEQMGVLVRNKTGALLTELNA